MRVEQVHFRHKLTGVEIVVYDDAVWVYGPRPGDHFRYRPFKAVGRAVAAAYIRHYESGPYWEKIG